MLNDSEKTGTPAKPLYLQNNDKCLAKDREIRYMYSPDVVAIDWRSAFSTLSASTSILPMPRPKPLPVTKINISMTISLWIVSGKTMVTPLGRL
jgi:hypothetical protein